MASVRRVARKWYARYRGADGKRHEAAIPAARRADAERLAHQLEAREWRIAQGLEVPPRAETVEAAAARYLRAVRHFRSWPSIESRWRLHILPVLGKVPVTAVRATLVDELLAKLEDEGYSQQTRRHVRMTLSAFFGWMRRDKAVSSNPVEDVEPIPVPAGSPKDLEEQDVLRVASGASFPGLRHLILLAFYSAARPGELLAARKPDVDLEAAQLRVERTLGSDTTKTGEARVVFLPVPALQILDEIFRTVPGEHLFLNARGAPMKLRRAERAFKVALKRAGLLKGWEVVCRRRGCGYREQRQPAPGERCPQCGFLLFARPLAADLCLKDLRSTSITQLIEKTGSIAAAQEQAGHAREETTQRHYRAVRKPYVADAVRRAFPGDATPQVPPRDGPDGTPEGESPAPPLTLH